MIGLSKARWKEITDHIKESTAYMAAEDVKDKELAKAIDRINSTLDNHEERINADEAFRDQFKGAKFVVASGIVILGLIATITLGFLTFFRRAI